MSAKTNYFKLGLFVLGGVVLFIAGLLAFGARHYFAETLRISAGLGESFADSKIARRYLQLLGGY